MALLWEKSRTWRKIVALSKASPTFFAGFTVASLGAAGALAYAIQKATDRNTDEFREELMKRSRKDAVMVNAANKERLGQLLKEIQQKDDFEDRYKAALNGETLTGTPDARVRGGSGTSATAEWVALAAEAQKAALEKGSAEKVVESSRPAKKHKNRAEITVIDGSKGVTNASEGTDLAQSGKVQEKGAAERRQGLPQSGPGRPETEKEEGRQSSWWSWGKYSYLKG
jgi:hypothetical protein